MELPLHSYIVVPHIFTLVLCTRCRYVFRMYSGFIVFISSIEAWMASFKSFTGSDFNLS